MSDALTNFTDFILKPSAPIVAGVGLFAVVWGFFKGVESVLTDDFKLEIAVWLLGRKKFGPKVQPWPDTFAKVFDRVFGVRHLSWKCFWRSCVASYSLYLLVLFLYSLASAQLNLIKAVFELRWLFVTLIFPFVMNALPDYVALLSTRLVLAGMRRTDKGVAWIILLALDLWLTTVIVMFPVMLLNAAITGGVHPVNLFTYCKLCTVHVLTFLKYTFLIARDSGGYVIFPAFFTSIWLWLYAGSGFLLKAARRFDIGFDWFNRKFDIEKKPLQSIGLVAGALVAFVYWSAVIVGRVI
jgi:hypothetical protein